MTVKVSVPGDESQHMAMHKMYYKFAVKRIFLFTYIVSHFSSPLIQTNEVKIKKLFDLNNTNDAV